MKFFMTVLALLIMTVFSMGLKAAVAPCPTFEDRSIRCDYSEPSAMSTQLSVIELGVGEDIELLHEMDPLAFENYVFEQLVDQILSDTDAKDVRGIVLSLAYSSSLEASKALLVLTSYDLEPGKYQALEAAINIRGRKMRRLLKKALKALPACHAHEAAECLGTQAREQRLRSYLN